MRIFHCWNNIFNKIGQKPTLPAAVCATPDIIRNLLRSNPERVRMLARTFGFGELPDDLTPENLDISTFCGRWKNNS